MATISEWLECRTKAGEPLPVEKCNAYRARRDLPPLAEEWHTSQPSRGLGDTVAKITHAIGLDAAAEAIAKAVGAKSCGCKARQAALNSVFPYTPEAGS